MKLLFKKINNNKYINIDIWGQANNIKFGDYTPWVSLIKPFKKEDKMDLSKKNKRNIRKIIRDSIHNFFEALLYSFFRPLICGHGDIEIPRAPGKKK